MWVKRGAALLAVVAVGLLIAACGSSSKPSSGSGSGGSGASSGSGSSATVNGHGATFDYNAAGGSADFVNALKDSFLPTFDKQYNFNTTVDTFCCGITKLQAEESSGNVTWSAIDWADTSDFKLAEQAHLLVPLNPKIVPLNLLKPGTYDKYGYQAYITGAVIGWLPKTYPAGGPQPTTFEDLFNTTKFPGKRCLYESPLFGGTLEGAELAAGIPANKLYPINFTAAFGELAKIKSDTVWWTSGAQAAQDLLSGQCKMTAIWNGVAQTSTEEGNPISISWNHAVIFAGYNSIPKGSPNEQAAQELLGLIVRDDAEQAKFASHVAYTEPTIANSIPAAYAKWAPQGANLKNAIMEDDDYYFANNAEVTKKFNDFTVTGKG
jgi:putative spermidine/putrescine transport system substrate-binding protein